ncbi:MAG TPA: NUDIX hydrolase [Acidimicrobiia bacterium]|nr:NUDIX hydrolase [Acidimicrobiia bacterium]
MNDLAPATAVEVRPAATVILVRDAPVPGGARLEVLMLRRHADSAFAAGAWVFPGGRVDAGDGEAPLPDEAYWVAAARECFEEAGILLARRADGAWLDTSGELDAARFGRHRRDVHAGRLTLAQVLDAEGIVLDVSGLVYVSRWITPPGAPRRFDTRFFVAAAPPGQAASHDTRETVASVWTTPALALERHAAGENALMFPTVKTLEALAPYDDVDALLTAARSIEEVPVIAPRVLRDPAGRPAVPEPPCPT